MGDAIRLKAKARGIAELLQKAGCQPIMEQSCSDLAKWLAEGLGGQLATSSGGEGAAP